MDKPTLYDILGVSPDATREEITSVFRSLSKRFHPDVHPDSGIDYTRMVDAYKTLTHPESRKSYDLKLANSARRRAVEEENRASLFRSLSADRVEYRHSLSNMLKSGTERSDAEEDIVVKVHPLEVKMGVTASIELPARQICPKCGGSGNSCYRCEGSGSIKTTEKLPFRVPSNSRNGDLVEFDASSVYQGSRSLLFRPRYQKIRIVFIQ